MPSPSHPAAAAAATPLAQQGAHTLSRFILDEFKGEQQEITFIMNAISVAAKIIAQAVQQAGIKPLNEFVRILLLITLNFVNLLLPFAPVFSPVSPPFRHPS